MTLWHDNTTWKWFSETENKTQSNTDNWYHFVAVSMPITFPRLTASFSFHPPSICSKPDSSFNFSIGLLFWVSKILSICSLQKRTIQGFKIFLSSRFLDSSWKKPQHVLEPERFSHHLLYPPCLFPLLWFVTVFYPFHKSKCHPSFKIQLKLHLPHGIFLDNSRIYSSLLSLNSYNICILISPFVA